MKFNAKKRTFIHLFNFIIISGLLFSCSLGKIEDSLEGINGNLLLSKEIQSDIAEVLIKIQNSTIEIKSDIKGNIVWNIIKKVGVDGISKYFWEFVDPVTNTPIMGKPRVTSKM